jgi:hypothetical protein
MHQAQCSRRQDGISAEASQSRAFLFGRNIIACTRKIAPRQAWAAAKAGIQRQGTGEIVQRAGEIVAVLPQQAPDPKRGRQWAESERPLPRRSPRSADLRAPAKGRNRLRQARRELLRIGCRRTPARAAAPVRVPQESCARSGRRSKTSLSSRGLRGAASASTARAPQGKQKSTAKSEKPVNLSLTRVIAGTHAIPAVATHRYPKGVYMSKLLSILVAALFATVSAGSFAASHGGAMKDDKKMEKKEEKKEMKKPKKRRKRRRKKKEMKKEEKKADKK